MSKTKNLMEVLRKKIDADPELQEVIEDDAFNVNVATEIFNRRLACRMTQQQLAEKLNTRQSAVARMEDADYSGHSLTQLRKVAKELGCTLEVKFKPKSDTSVTFENFSQPLISSEDTSAESYPTKSSASWTVEQQSINCSIACES